MRSSSSGGCKPGFVRRGSLCVRRGLKL